MAMASANFAFAESVDEFGNIDVYRDNPVTHMGLGQFKQRCASSMAVVLGVTGGHFVKIMLTNFCRLFRHGISHSSTHLQ
jgi:hypothetical protein